MKDKREAQHHCQFPLGCGTEMAQKGNDWPLQEEHSHLSVREGSLLASKVQFLHKSWSSQNWTILRIEIKILNILFEKFQKNLVFFQTFTEKFFAGVMKTALNVSRGTISANSAIYFRKVSLHFWGLWANSFGLVFPKLHSTCPAVQFDRKKMLETF